MNDNDKNHISFCKENEGNVEYFVLASGISISFNQIYTNNWSKGDGSIFSDQMLILNFCLNGRCDVSLAGNRYAIVGEGQVCVSTILPTKDFYYPGRLYEGVQLYIDLKVVKGKEDSDFLSLLGLHVDRIIQIFCENDGLYLHQMSDRMQELVEAIWKIKEVPERGRLRYFTVRLLYELMEMPHESESRNYFTKSQIAIVREAESLIMQDLSKRVTAKEMAEKFGISESSFKQYVKGILGESYLNYFRKKRMERAADLLKTTDLKVIEVANAVGYENQGKFAKVFAEQYGIAPLEFRRLPK